ncbi:MAG: Av71 muscle cell intermediate filament [Verrucomicrobia bacterium]|nr:MAG: Av71 muscle cell intermediate filament [Verrucomicrobiota bacterium]
MDFFTRSEGSGAKPPRFAIRNPQSAIRNRQSAIRNRKLTIGIP